MDSMSMHHITKIELERKEQIGNCTEIEIKITNNKGQTTEINLYGGHKVMQRIPIEWINKGKVRKY